MTNRITIIDNLWAIAEAGDCHDIEALLRFHPKGYIFAPSYKARRWDGFVSMVSHRKVKPIEQLNYEPQDSYCAVYIPAGLVPFVTHQPWAQTYGVDDLRTEPPEYLNFPERDESLPWDADQEEAVEAALQLKHGLVKYPTGTGKGRIIGETVRRLKRRTIVLVDKIDLLTQLGDQISLACGRSARAFGGNNPSLWGIGAMDDVVIATYQTIESWLDGPDKNKVLAWLETFDVVLVDEAHHVEAQTYQHVLQCIPAYFRIGYSATPFKAWTPGSKAELGTYLRVQAWLGPLAAEMSLQEGTETGRIVPADVYFFHGCTPEGDGKVDVPVRRPMNWMEEYEWAITGNFRRNATIIKLAEKWVQTGPTIILVERLDHGHALAGRLNWPFVHGATEERGLLYDEFRDGRTRGLIISKIGDEALDLPNVERVILAGGGKAPHRQTQRIGRGMRASAGKAQVMVADFEDYGHYTSSHYRARRRQYEAEEAYTVVDVEASMI
jgi:superfamily II DNA or RNA helicase